MFIHPSIVGMVERERQRRRGRRGEREREKEERERELRKVKKVLPVFLLNFLPTQSRFF